MDLNEKRFWQDQAALLDPNAFVLRSKVTRGADFVESVPSGEQWYVMNAFWVCLSGNDAPYCHRTPDVLKATPLGAGTKIEFGASDYSFHYTCRPEVVICKDKRYQDAPKELYFSRLNRMRALPASVIKVAIDDNAAYGVTTETPFPADFANALVTSYSNLNMAWGGLGSANGAMNLGPEMSDDHQNRIGERTLFPFSRSVFTTLRARGGSVSGLKDIPYIRGNCQVTYLKLPSDW